MIEGSIDSRLVAKRIRMMAARANNPEPAMAGISMRMLAAVEDNFAAEGRPLKWKPLAPSTTAARAAEGKAGKILQATGNLARSITPFNSREVAGVGTNIPYAAAMNNGSKAHTILPKNKKSLYFGGRFAGKVKHPGTEPRPFMVLVDRDKFDVVMIMAAHLQAGG